MGSPLQNAHWEWSQAPSVVEWCMGVSARVQVVPEQEGAWVTPKAEVKPFDFLLLPAPL